MENKSQRIIIPLPNGYKLVAESNIDETYPYEIYIGILGSDDIWYQDLAIVRNSYHYENDEPIWENDEFDVIVYSDENNEDFTHDFSVGIYKGGI